MSVRLEWTLEEIAALRPYNFVDKPMTREEFAHIGRTVDAFWMYQGDPRPDTYHAELASGKHSNGFINVSTILAYTPLCETLALQMIWEFSLRNQGADIVVGPGNAAITLSYEIARQLKVRHGFTEKGGDGKPTKFGGRTTIKPLECALVVNELMTTADGSTHQCIQGIEAHQPMVKIVPFVPVLVKRSRESALVNGTPVRPLFSFDIENYPADACPYCEAGSKAIKPKLSAENWAKLTGKAQ